MANKNRLIYENELLERVADMSDLQMNGVTIAVAIAKCSTVDAEEVVHGRWIRKGNKNECDRCGFFYYSTRADYRRCPKCEAKMDLKEADHEPLR